MVDDQLPLRQTTFVLDKLPSIMQPHFLTSHSLHGLWLYSHIVADPFLLTVSPPVTSVSSAAFASPYPAAIYKQGLNYECFTCEISSIRWA